MSVFKILLLAAIAANDTFQVRQLGGAAAKAAKAKAAKAKAAAAKKKGGDAAKGGDNAKKSGAAKKEKVIEAGKLLLKENAELTTALGKGDAAAVKKIELKEEQMKTVVNVLKLEKIEGAAKFENLKDLDDTAIAALAKFAQNNGATTIAKEDESTTKPPTGDAPAPDAPAPGLAPSPVPAPMDGMMPDGMDHAMPLPADPVPASQLPVVSAGNTLARVLLVLF